MHPESSKLLSKRVLTPPPPPPYGLLCLQAIVSRKAYHLRQTRSPSSESPTSGSATSTVSKITYRQKNYSHDIVISSFSSVKEREQNPRCSEKQDQLLGLGADWHGFIFKDLHQFQSGQIELFSHNIFFKRILIFVVLTYLSTEIHNCASL